MSKMNAIEQKRKRKELYPEANAKLKFNANRDIPVYLLILPAALLLFVFHYLPIYGIVISFQDFSPFKGVLNSNWVGLKNFEHFLSDSNFWRVFKNTIIINLMQIIIGFPIPVMFAIFLNELWSNRFKKVVQTVSYLPHFISWVVAASIITSALSPSSGLINKFLEGAFGIEPIYFLAKEEYFRVIIVISNVWKELGMQSVYYIAALASIDTELYEAAKMDGAGKIKQTIHITLPGLRSIIIVLLVLKIGRMVTIGFEQIFLLYNPLVYDVGDVISTYTYRLGIEQTRYSLTSAIGVTQSVVNFILVYAANKAARKIAGWSLW
ncbi:MAG: ABC transporter permease subunit [Ruminiclostridium sp.]|nr:ABC transporter permease subunit [Ruminiclostridium sp.]